LTSVGHAINTARTQVWFQVDTSHSIKYHNWLGDPSLDIWTQNPQQLTVNCDTTLSASFQGLYQVTVSNGMMPIEDAIVTIVLKRQILIAYRKT
jgi:hypothetical protein